MHARSGNEIRRFSGGRDQLHFDNFVSAVRSRRQQDLHGEIEEGHLSSAICHLANISTRAVVQTGDNVLIGGFIVLDGSRKVLLRAIAPSLPVAGKLADPLLELHDGNGALLQSNDNWKTNQKAEIEASTIPPSNDLESAIVRTLPAGNYTAIVRGAGNKTGVAVVEAYALN